MGLFNNWGYSLILRRNARNDSSLEVSCNMEPEIVSVNFTYSVTLISTGLSCTLDGSFIHAWLYNSVLWSSGKYLFTDLRTSSKRWHISLYEIEIIIQPFISPLTSSEKSLITEELGRLWWYIRVFQNLIFIWKLHVILGKNTVSCFSRNDWPTLCIF